MNKQTNKQATNNNYIKLDLYSGYKNKQTNKKEKKRKVKKNKLKHTKI